MRRRRRRRRKTEDGATTGSALSGDGVINGNGGEEDQERVTRGKSAPSLVTQGLLDSSSSNPDKPSYQALAAE